MMVTIRGLPLKTKYQDVKVLLKNECSISEFILDDLVNDESGMSKKVRVGLVEDSDGYAVMKCLNGLRMPGNNVLRVEIVGKPPAGGQQGNAPYEHKPASSFNNEYRNNYSNQQTMDFRGRTNTSGFGASYPAQNTQFPGPTQSLGAPGVHGSISSHATVDSRPSPWVSNNTPSNQWNLNQPMGAQNSFQPPGNQGYTHQFSSNTQRSNAGTFVQGRGQHDQGYGYSAKTNTHDMGGPRKADTRHHVLRNVELVDTQVTNPPLQSGRYPPNQGFQQKPSGRYPPSQGSQQQQKSITIMKDNFQGATSYDMGSSNQPSPYQRQSQGSPQTWVQQEIRTDVYRNFEKPAQRLSPHRQVAPVGRSFSPTRRLISPSGRRPSPPRHLGPARGASPPRHLGPARGASPPRHLGPARGASPPRHLGPARGASPPRHLGPARGASPPRHLGPARGASPPRHLVPARGASPPRHLGSARGASPPRHLGPARGASPPRHLGPARGPSPPRHLGPTRGASPPRHSGPVSQPPPRHLGPARGASPPNPLPLGRRLSPSGRHQSPTRRLISPADRMMSTMDRRPGGPPRDLPQRSGRGNAPRYSPQRHHGDKPIDKNIDPETLKSSKHIRPAYDATSQAPNQPIYSGGFRPNVHDNAPFPRNTRQLEQDVPWQQDGDQIYAKMKKRDEEGPVASRQNTYGDKHSPRKSRSPIRRDRSPIRDRYRKHSPSSTSPRRSWAFEKRRSPEVHDAPLPPNWPGQEIRDDGRFKHASDRKEDNSKHIPVWEKQPFAKRDESKRGNEKIDSYGGPSKVFRGDLNSKVDTSRGEQFSKHHRDSKFGTRNEFENRPGYRQAADDGPKAYLKQKDQDYLYSVEHENIRRYGDSKRKGSPRRDEEKNNDFKKLDKDIENVYKRAQEFKQKTEELRKSQRRMKEHSEERGRTARIREEKDFEVHNAASTRRIDDITRRHMDDSPRRRMNNSPRHHMDDSPRRYMEDSPRRHIEGSPRHHMNNSPVRRMEVSPRRLIEGSPRRRMDNSPRRRMENSPRQRMENSPRRHVEGSPRRRVDDSAHQPRCDTDNRRRDEIDTKASLSREPIWNAVDESRNIFAELPSHIKVKRFKAAEEISNKLMNKKPIVAGLSREARLRVMEELKKTVSHKLNELFDTEDVSFIELVIKFKSRISDAEKDKIFDDVIKSLPSRLRNMKALGEDSPNVPSKRSSKLSSDYKLKEEYSDVPPQKKAKLAPENKIKEEDTLRTQGSTYKRTQRPLNTEKLRHIREPRIMRIDRIVQKSKILKKNVTTPKIIKKDVPSKNSMVKEKKEQEVEEKSTAAETVTAPVKLDPLTAQVVESELQDIMIKVWQQLPDRPTDKAEQFVVDKFRNNAGDSLRNILGLNVTKRLLNVFNTLLVKLDFSALPKREDVIKLMRKYDLRGLKRLQKEPIIFGASVKTIEAFDIICSEKLISCGSVKVTVIPVYKFDKCPKNLITNFDDKEITEENINKTVRKSSISETKLPEKVTEVPKVEEVKEVPKLKKVIEEKPKIEQKIQKPVNESSKKVDLVYEPKPQRKNLKSVRKVAATRKTTKEETKRGIKKPEPTKLKDNSSINNVFKEGNDFDELDDDTILALMSEGIVVDECSGSE